jgi:thiol-disulfide isomerase/thioredoxin
MLKRTSSLLPILVLCVAGFAGCKQHPAGPPPEQTSIHAGEIGSSLPSFSVKDLQGKTLTSADLRGKVLLVDFWGTWCEPCRTEMPGYQALQNKYGSAGLVVVGFKVDVMADTEDPLQFAQKLEVRYPLVVGTEEIRSKFGGLEGLPTTMIYDRNGILRSKVIGFEYTTVIESTLKTLL